MGAGECVGRDEDGLHPGGRGVAVDQVALGVFLILQGRIVELALAVVLGLLEANPTCHEELVVERELAVRFW